MPITCGSAPPSLRPPAFPRHPLLAYPHFRTKGLRRPQTRPRHRCKSRPDFCASNMNGRFLTTSGTPNTVPSIPHSQFTEGGDPPCHPERSERRERSRGISLLRSSSCDERDFSTPGPSAPPVEMTRGRPSAPPVCVTGSDPVTHSAKCNTSGAWCVYQGAWVSKPWRRTTRPLRSQSPRARSYIWAIHRLNLFATSADRFPWSQCQQTT